MTFPWAQLLAARSFSLRMEPRTGPSLWGRGRIRVEGAEPAVVWREEGCWLSGPLAGISFHNATAWHRAVDGTAVDLSHLRRGDTRPTFLVRLVPAAVGRWSSAEPHRCGADLYSAWLSTTPDDLTLGWEVEGPSDQYRLEMKAAFGPVASTLEGADALGA